MTSAATQVGNCLDLITLLLRDLDWATLINFSRVARSHKSLAVSEIRLRISYFLRRFIPYDQQNTFWTLLSTTRSCVFGGVVRAMMMAGNPSYYGAYPPQMDIIVPPDDQLELTHPQDAFTTFFGNLGYTETSEPVQQDPFDGCTRQITHYTFPNQPWPRICILFGNMSSPLWVALHAPSTDALNFLTPRAIYDFYPFLIDQAVTITQPHSVPIPTFTFSFGLRTYKVDSQFYRNCPSTCAVKWRSANTTRQIRVFTWQQTKADFFLADPRLQWRLGRICTNHACPNSHINHDYRQVPSTVRYIF